jgi:hypothetical protein
MALLAHIKGGTVKTSKVVARMIGASARLQYAEATHVRAQHFRNHDTAISLLEVLKHRYKRTSNGKTRTIECMHELSLTGRGACASLHASSLKTFAI